MSTSNLTPESAFGSRSVEKYVPASALTITGGTVVIELPRMPGQVSLPEFQSVSIDFYRLDDGATAQEMYRHLWNRRTEPLPSFAMQSTFEAL